MKVNNIITILVVAFILTSCAPAVTVVSPTETTVPMPTFSPVPPTATVAPTLTPENVVPTSEPTAALSAEGPWLLYVHNSPRPGFADLESVPPEFVILNQDGSGHTSFTLPECHGQVNRFLMEGENSVNYMTQYDGGLYIFRPFEATGMLVYQRLWYSFCNTFFTGDENGGLLASNYQAEGSDIPELIIYELPAGKIRDRFALVRCGEDANVCNQYRSNWKEMGGQQFQWSPNGRYLAFAAVLDADSSDLFVYDSQDGSLRRLTSGPDWVGPIEWSPDGTQLIMQELLNDSEYFYAPHSKPPASVWSVSVSTSEIELLYSTDDAYTEQTILQWVDDKRFVAYEGYLFNANSARNLRFVDMEAGTNRILFNGEFGTIKVDPIHETFALYALYEEQYGQGIFLVSINNSKIRPLETTSNLTLPDWDSETGLFVSEEECENDPQSYQAFDYQGNLSCVPKPTPNSLDVASYPSSDRKWTVSVNDGLWLETEGKPPVLISQETPSDIIWCLDSTCFFFSEFQQNQQQKNQWTLYRASLPDLTIKMVDEGIESGGTYQWLGAEQ